MVIYNCQTCKKENGCSLQNDYARTSLFAFGRGADIPDCSWHQPNYWHGVEGVVQAKRTSFNSARNKAA